MALYVTNNIVADSLVIYRCYVIWGFSLKIVAAPAIMLFSTSICGYAAVYNFTKTGPGENVFASRLADWGTAVFSLSLSTNIVVTCLIAGRIYWIARKTSRLLGTKHSRKYHNALAIIVESGAIYAMSLLTLLVLYCLKSGVQYIMFDVQAQIMGIVPTMIIVRVGLGASTQDTMMGASNARVPPSATTARLALNRAAHSEVRMQVQRVIHVNGDTADLGREDLDSEDTGKHHSYPHHSFGDV
ncbi:hypothetical protein DFH06DRAFT_112681 [Mycena polygramma]|nr:hypothetical protein DFH06DRAFT_112681 [Mycena polygramma]